MTTSRSESDVLEMDDEGVKVWRLLEGRYGEAMAITAERLGEASGVGDSVTTREAITRNLEAFPDIVIAGGRGYYLAETPEDVARYDATLRSRAIEHLPPPAALSPAGQGLRVQDSGGPVGKGLPAEGRDAFRVGGVEADMAEARTERLEMVACALVVPTGDNARVIDVEGASFKELVESVRAQGVLVPVHVRPHPVEEGKYDLRAGERRLRAAVAAGLAEDPGDRPRGDDGRRSLRAHLDRELEPRGPLGARGGARGRAVHGADRRRRRRGLGEDGAHRAMGAPARASGLGPGRVLARRGRARG